MSKQHWQRITRMLSSSCSDLLSLFKAFCVTPDAEQLSGMMDLNIEVTQVHLLTVFDKKA